jgi:hypothetical protein
MSRKEQARGRRKGPVAGAKPSARKRPVAGSHDGDKKTVVWGLDYLDMDGRWGWGRCAQKHLGTILAFLRNLERLVHTEAFGRKHKFVKIDALCPDAQKRLAEIELDDLDGLWELRVSGERRIWGHRVGHVFYPVWWDPEHAVCPSEKKHT